MVQTKGKKSLKKAMPTGALVGGFIGGILFFKAIMMVGDYHILKAGTYLTNDVIQSNYVLRATAEKQERELQELSRKYESLASRKAAKKDLNDKRMKYHQELKALFEDGLAIGRSYRATDVEAAEGKIWEDKTRQVLKALSIIETQVQGHSVSLDFQGNFIWYSETNPNYNHAREIIRERLNDIRHALVVLDTAGIAVAD